MIAKVGKRTGQKPIVEIDELCKMLGVETLDARMDALDSFDGGSYGYVFSEAKKEGKSDDEAEELAQTAEQQERDEIITKYKDAVLAVAEELFEKHKLKLVPIVRKRHNPNSNVWSWRVVPGKTWTDSLGHIVTTINGVGMFEFSSVRELCESGPWSPKVATLSHLHWIADWPDVYEGTKARSLVERRLR